MPMIQPIDGSVLLNAFRQGREDRLSDQEKQLAIRAKRAALDKQQQVTGLLGQLYGADNPPQGVAGNYAPENPQREPSRAFTDAFGGSSLGGANDMDSPANGGFAGQYDQRNREAMGTPAMPAARPVSGDANGDILRKLIIIDPETGSKVAEALKTQSEMSLKQQQGKNDIMGAAAHHLLSLSPEQRGPALEQMIPQLQAAGWSPQEIARADLSDGGLKTKTALAIDYDKMIDNELAQREFEAGKVVTPQAGAGAFIAHPNGQVDTLIAPNDGSHPAGAPVRGGVGAPAAAIDHLRQHPELKSAFDAKYGAGAADRALGGGAGNGTGGFRP